MPHISPVPSRSPSAQRGPSDCLASTTESGRLPPLALNSGPRHKFSGPRARLDAYLAAAAAATAAAAVPAATAEPKGSATQPVVSAPVPPVGPSPAAPASTATAASAPVAAAQMRGRVLYVVSMLATAVGTATLGPAGVLAAVALGLAGTATFAIVEAVLGSSTPKAHLAGSCMASGLVGLAMTALMPASPWAVLGITAGSLACEMLASAEGRRRSPGAAAQGLPYKGFADVVTVTSVAVAALYAPQTLPRAVVALLANTYGSAALCIRTHGQGHIDAAANRHNSSGTAFVTYASMLVRGAVTGSLVPTLLP